MGERSWWAPARYNRQELFFAIGSNCILTDGVQGTIASLTEHGWIMFHLDGALTSVLIFPHSIEEIPIINELRSKALYKLVFYEPNT